MQAQRFITRANEISAARIGVVTEKKINKLTPFISIQLVHWHLVGFGAAFIGTKGFIKLFDDEVTPVEPAKKHNLEPNQCGESLAEYCFGTEVRFYPFIQDQMHYL
jgi:hypothetical protein